MAPSRMDAKMDRALGSRSVGREAGQVRLYGSVSLLSSIMRSRPAGRGRDRKWSKQGEFMWQGLMTWLARHLHSRYVRLLEEETTRLRAENRALVNSLLGTAGFPPIALEEGAARLPVALPPVRRRTWTQFARERELAALRSPSEPH
jgi:hypothetical protein